MLAAFLQFDNETCLVIGLTHDDLTMLAMGDEPPTMNLGQLATDLESPLPSRLTILVGPNNEAIQARLQSAMSPDTVARMIPENEVAGYLGVELTPEETAAAEAELASVETALTAARELAVKQARARLN